MRRHPNFLDDEPFWSITSSGCWIWKGAPDLDGYGRWGRNRRMAYRVVWELVHGSTRLNLHHLCEIKRCVNPDHLKPVDEATHNRIHHMK